MSDLRKEIELGTKIEMEHTQDKALAQKISMDHISEDPQYYTKLMNAGLRECGEETVVMAISAGTLTSNKPNSVSFSSTVKKVPASSGASDGVLVNQTTGAKMPNQVSIDGGTPQINQPKTADALSFFLGKSIPRST